MTSLLHSPRGGGWVRETSRVQVYRLQSLVGARGLQVLGFRVLGGPGRDVQGCDESRI